ncbi:MAG: hypothetical protein HY791_32565 [Deltaproteobacteria bacterium]|nr:hypothetical protein [Deltaproteobacteria bacterium]
MNSLLLCLGLFAAEGAEEPPLGQEPAEGEVAPDAQPNASDELPFNDAQLDYIEKLRDDLREEMQSASAGAKPAASAPSAIELKADAYIKWLFRNNSSQGCVTYGNPHPRGDNYSGDNGACPELGLSLIGRPSPRIEVGFRIQSRYGQDFADWFENGDLADAADASGESLGQNHSAPLQLRGIYARINEPLPFLDWFLAGSSDLSYFDAFTVGKVRYIDRFNAKGLFLAASPGGFDLLVARIALAKLFGTANYNGLEEPLLTNPFWARDAIYALRVGTPKSFDAVRLTLNAAVTLDEEADLDDPDAPGSSNTADPRDYVTAVEPRFLGANASLTAEVSSIDPVRIKGVLALSHNDPNPAYVSNLARGGLGFSNVVFDTTTDVAATLRVGLPDLLGDGLSLDFEYFNIGSDFNAVAGARREDDILLTDGFMDGGQVPTLNVANELIDFTDVFYESVVGWHGATAMFNAASDFVDASVEATLIEYNTDQQGRDMDVYPGFGGFTGFTDTDLYSYANTNDRGRDLRTVYARDQGRRSMLFVGKATLKPTWWPGAKLLAKAKYIVDTDLRSDLFDEDDYEAGIFRAKVGASARPFEELSVELGLGFDAWNEVGRSGTYAGGAPDFVDYETTKLRPYITFDYSIGALSARYHFELVQKNVIASDAELDVSVGPVLRSVGFLSAAF